MKSLCVLLLSLHYQLCEGKRDGPAGSVVIEIPPDSFHQAMNVLLRIATLIIYGALLAQTVFHVVKYVIFKKRYKEFSTVTYYLSVLGLFATRIVQTVLQFSYINSDPIKTAIVVADGFAVCVGLSQIALIGDLIITLQYYEAQGACQDRDTISSVTNRSYAIEKRTICKRRILNVGVFVLIVAAIGEIYIRTLMGYQYPYIILQAQLDAIGACLLVETIAFLRLSKRVFEGEFEEEQRFFKHSLIVFLSTYLVRSGILLIIIFEWGTYEGWYESMPIFAATCQCFVHLIYDALPIMHLMLRHHRTFKDEDKEVTTVVMSSFSCRETAYYGNKGGTEDYSRFQTLKQLEHFRSTIGSRPRLSTTQRRTILNEELILLDCDHTSDRSASIKSINSSNPEAAENQSNFS